MGCHVCNRMLSVLKQHWICRILGHSFRYLKPWFICARCGLHIHNPYPPQGNIPPPGVVDHNFLLNVTADQHHNEDHVLATTGPHTNTLPLTDLEVGVQGNVIHRGVGDWEVLAVGVAGQALLTGGAGVDVSWGAPAPAVHGAAQHTDVTRELFIPAHNTYDVNVTDESYGSYSCLNCADAVDSYIPFTFKVPDDFVSFVSIKLVWACASAAGNLYWRLHTAYAAAGESGTTHIDEPALGATATGGTAVTNAQEPANPLTMVSLALGDYVGIKFRRAGGDGLDTLDLLVSVYGILFTYTAEQ